MTAVSPGEEAVVVLTLAEEPTADQGFASFFDQAGVEGGDWWRRLGRA